MNTLKTLTVLLIVAVFASCSNDDEPKNHAPVSEDMVLNMDENPTSDLLTTIVATDLDGDDLQFSIVSQTPTGSVIINETTGEVYIGNSSIFDYEQNTVITVIIAVTDGVSVTEITLTINIQDVNENG